MDLRDEPVRRVSRIHFLFQVESGKNRFVVGRPDSKGSHDRVGGLFRLSLPTEDVTFRTDDTYICKR